MKDLDKHTQFVTKSSKENSWVISIKRNVILFKIASQIYPWINAVEFLTLKITGYIPSNHIRNMIYRIFRVKIGKGSHIYGGAEIRAPHRIEIGTGSSIGHDALLDGRGYLSIGNNVNLSSGVWIWTSEHDVNSLEFIVRSNPVVIKDYVWLSCRVVVLPGVTIGEGAVVAAGAVVTKDIEPYTICAGIPARKIGIRPKGLNYNLSKYIPMI